MLLFKSYAPNLCHGGFGNYLVAKVMDLPEMIFPWLKFFMCYRKFPLKQA